MKTKEARFEDYAALLAPLEDIVKSFAKSKEPPFKLLFPDLSDDIQVNFLDSVFLAAARKGKGPGEMWRLFRGIAFRAYEKMLVEVEEQAALDSVRRSLAGLANATKRQWGDTDGRVRAVQIFMNEFRRRNKIAGNNLMIRMAVDHCTAKPSESFIRRHLRDRSLVIPPKPTTR